MLGYDGLLCKTGKIRGNENVQQTEHAQVYYVSRAEAERDRDKEKNIYYDGHVNKLGFYMRIRDVCPFLLMC